MYEKKTWNINVLITQSLKWSFIFYAFTVIKIGQLVLSKYYNGDSSVLHPRETAFVLSLMYGPTSASANGKLTSGVSWKTTGGWSKTRSI